jgi:MerR family transcriptional regulator, mercuric resistance operon regulatory protein
MAARPSYTIGTLAKAAGVHIETIRYYQRRGLLAQPERFAGMVRRYGAGDAERLRVIRRAQAMGFTLAEIGNLLKLTVRSSCPATRELAAAKLRLVEQRLGELRELRRELMALIADCDANPEPGSCPVIARLAERGAAPRS